VLAFLRQKLGEESTKEEPKKEEPKVGVVGRGARADQRRTKHEKVDGVLLFLVHNLESRRELSQEATLILREELVLGATVHERANHIDGGRLRGQRRQNRLCVNGAI
jgi:hypothetical protein